MLTKFPQFDKLIEISLFTEVENAREIQRELLAGNKDFDFAFVDSANVTSLEHLRAAIYRALLDDQAGQRRTKTIHSEIVFSMSPNNNIMDGLKRFGINAESRAIYVVRVGTTEAELAQAYGFIKSYVQGVELDITEENINRHMSQFLVKKVRILSQRITASIGSLL
jgi:EKC/KEOPS complex subunit CGI121/TPRKB